MKKITFFLGLISVLSTAQVNNFPWTETFEDTSPTQSQWVCEHIAGTNSSVPSGLFWSIKTTTSVGYFSSTGAYNGSKMAVFDTRSHTRDAIARFISPVIDLSTTTNPTLDFYYRNMEWGGDQNVLNIYYRSSSSEPWTLITTFDTNVPAWVNSGVIDLPNPSSTYQIALEGVADYGYGLDVDDLKISSSTLGVSEINSKAPKLKISPNPVSDVLNIHSKEKVTEVTIMDFSGKIIKVDPKEQIPVQHLNAGIYFITVKYSNGATATSKFIKK